MLVCTLGRGYGRMDSMAPIVYEYEHVKIGTELVWYKVRHENIRGHRGRTVLYVLLVNRCMMFMDPDTSES